jgi:hypothetical protein
VPPRLADKTVHTFTNAREQRVAASAPAEATPAACVDARLERQRRTIGAGHSVLSRGTLKAGERRLESAEVSADLLGKKVWSRLLAGAGDEGPWLLEISALQPDPALVQNIVDTLRDTATFKPVAGAPERDKRWFCGSVCFELPADFTTEWATWLEGEAGTLKLFLDRPCAPPEEMFYSDPPLEPLERNESRIDSAFGRIAMTVQAVKVHGATGPSEKVHLSATLPLPDRPALSAVGVGDRAQHGALDRAFRTLLTSVKVAKRRG